jgi:cell division protein FtsZ
LGTGIAEGEDRINAATDRAISNPLLENNTISGAKGVLINISCGNDTSLHEVETAVSKVKEEVDINANLIWGIQQDDKLDGKFRISVIATGIESESYYQNLIDSNNSNEAFINEFSTTQIHNENINQLNSDLEENSNQREGFKIKLQESKRSIDDDLKDQQKMIHDENIKVSKKTTFFQKLFGKNTKADKKIEESKVNFFDEIREISEENGSPKTDVLNDRPSDPSLSDNNLSQLNDSQSSMVKEDNEAEINSDENSNEINDDLLQIPAFLRRQAN